MKKLTTANELLKHYIDSHYARYRKYWKNIRNKPHQRRFKMTRSRRDRVLRQIVKRDLAAGNLIFRG
ncbi:DUF7301 family protein [Xenorhabdus bovienii]|uniref:DUF7301 family protein n=1 Tax=Xenorhabdus bovienii TaxID=40576 RepID=UPI0023B3568F|nr:hypothetical protein [Xenorhabdus bovienii]MDE9483648.1 hypothetical protein [Xenorhabdus bovienii]